MSCSDNQLTNVDLTKNENLTTLNLDNNSLSAIDLSKNKLLNTLSLRNNKLESLNLVNNRELVNLYVNNNLLTSIDLKLNGKLGYLHINDNNLNTIDITYNEELIRVNCQNNNLTEIATPHSSNFRIQSLDCSNNNLTELNLSMSGSSSDFKYLNCSDNAINGEAVQRFVDKLPTAKSSNKAELVFKSSSATEKNSMSQEQVLIIMAKDWTVRQTNGNAYLGEESGVEGIEVDPIDNNAPRYNLMGQPVNDSYHGVVIQKGKKVLIK